jgi:Reverse transcriptase (RNA-dependent DNA polymerase).
LLLFIIYTLLFADDEVLITQEYKDMEFMVRKLLEEYEKWSLKINLEKTFYVVCGAETEDLIMEDQKGYKNLE